MRTRTKPPYTLQCEILDLAESHNIELAQALAMYGYEIDDLAYQVCETRHWTTGEPPRLDAFRRRSNDVPVVSFFSGCGGMDIGFETAGFTHMAAYEVNEIFCKTLRHNRPDWSIFGPPTSAGDVSDFEATVGLLQSLIPQNFEGVFVGGPPCQPFSIAANQRFSKSGDNFKRTGFANEQNGNLLFDYVRLIEHFRPTCFVVENVPGLRDLDDGKQISLLTQRLSGSGYDVGEPRVLDAANFNVPQYRERLFLVGTRCRRKFDYPPRARTQFGSGSVLDQSLIQTTNHETRMHKPSSVRRYAKLKYGQRDTLGRVDRLDPTLPSKAVIAGGTKGGGRSHLHPEIPRTLSVRESARLQTFPDEYRFVGSTARQFTQVGNAVPPVLAAQVALAIAHCVYGIDLT